MSKIYGQRLRLDPIEEQIIKKRKDNSNRVLVIGDLHSPFIKEGYLEFCLGIKEKYNCNIIIFIGDLIDNHASSYHETDPDGFSAKAELEEAKAKIQAWYYTFPQAKVCIGNHDRIPSRKVFTSGVSSSWVKTIQEVLETPNWEYGVEFLIDDVKYVHGTSNKARARAKNDLISIVQGHYHTESYIDSFVGDRYRIFAMQIGSGIDRTAYSMARAIHFKKMQINCGVVLDNGKLPIIEFMDL